MLAQYPEALAAASLMTAGNAVLHLKHTMRLDDHAIKQLIVYYPQVLSMNIAEVTSMVKMISQHNTTHGC
jgi:hypothetical protein